MSQNAGAPPPQAAPRRKVDVSGALAALVLSVFFLILLFALIPRFVPTPPGQALRPISPAFFPIIVSALGVISALVALAEAVFIGRRADDDREVFTDYPAALAILRLVAVLGVAFAFYLLLRPLGALPTSALAMFLLMLLGGVRRPVTLLALSVALPAVIYFVFVRVALVPFPRGIMPF